MLSLYNNIVIFAHYLTHNTEVMKQQLTSKFDTQQEANRAANLAIGRLFLLGSRPFQEGDIKKYEAAKWIFYDAMDYLGITVQDTSPAYTRDYFKIHHD